MSLKLSLDPDKCQLYLFSGSHPQDLEFIHRQAYLCWRGVWEHVLQVEMNQDVKLYADDFLRQEHIVSLFYQGQCVGMAFIRHADLSHPAFLKDSYFRYWPSHAVERVQTMTKAVALASYFTVSADFRGKDQPVCWKTLLLALFLRAFNDGPSPLMITSARKARSNEKLCKKLGAQEIARDVPFTINGKVLEQEMTDIIYWTKSALELEDPALTPLADLLWSRRQVPGTMVEGDDKGEQHAA